MNDEETTKVVNKFIEVNKSLFYTKDEMDKKFDKQQVSFSSLQTSVESFAVGTKNNEDEIKAVTIELASTKLG